MKLELHSIEQASSENSSVDLEFVSSFPLLNCVQRLEGRHEKMTLFAWGWQRRLWVRTWKIREGLYGFKMMYVDKNGYLPISYCSVKGYLKSFEGSDTVVLAQKHFNYLMIVGFAILFGVAMGFAFGSNETENTPTTGIVVGLVVGAIILAVSWVDSIYLTRKLIGVVKESLGGLNDLPPSSFN